MKRYIVFFFIILFPTCLMAQQYAEYNRKGDEAMAKKDYYDARFWYGGGIEYCDMYSIKQLTTIWLENASMRSSMRNIMGRCFTCLDEKAAQDDLAAISQLILFYREGIGTEKNETQALAWEERKNTLESPRIDPVYGFENGQATPRDPMRFFAGYAFSTEMPFGITIGGIQNKMGWYARVRSNFSFMNADKECELIRNAEGTDISHVFDTDPGKTYYVNQAKNNRKNSIAGTAGFIFKTTSWLHLSVGAGYGERTLLTPFLVRDNNSIMEEEEIWCKNRTYSYKGAMVEADAMVSYKNLFFSVGCHTMSFDYVDLNVGVGVFF